VTDLKLGEILIREDGVDREVVSVSPATQPIYAALLVDTTAAAEPYIRDIRSGLVAFAGDIRGANPDARLSVTEFGQAAVPIVPFTTDASRLEREIKRIFPKRDAPSVLLEALIDASNSLARQNSPRRAIVVFNMEGTLERSREEPAKIQEAMMRAGAQLWVLSLQKDRLKQETLSQRDRIHQRGIGNRVVDEAVRRRAGFAVRRHVQAARVGSAEGRADGPHATRSAEAAREPLRAAIDRSRLQG
jgi:hypothetical protein